jgi:hypothetical protein
VREAGAPQSAPRAPRERHANAQDELASIKDADRQVRRAGRKPTGGKASGKPAVARKNGVTAEPRVSKSKRNGRS